VILSNSASELGELLAEVTDPSSDALATDRRELKEYLLGPDEPASIDQFNTAVRDLAKESLARNLGQETGASAAAVELANGVPGQRKASADETGGAAVKG
jgi:hypothetical protein